MISNRMTAARGIAGAGDSRPFAWSRTELHLRLEGPKDGERLTDRARHVHVHDLDPQRAVRSRVADVVALRLRYCIPASTSAEWEIPSSAPWTMRKMKTAAAAANAIRYRGK
jgi:hypothetical protein